MKAILRYPQLAGVVLALTISLGLYAASWSLPANILLGLISVAVIIPMAVDMVKSVLHREFGIDLLAVTAVLTAILLGEYLTAGVIILMLSGGEALEDYAQAHAKQELSGLLNRAPKIAHRWDGRQTHDIPVSHVQPGDELLIKPGEIVPVDSVITQGASSFDESSLTGESLPVDKTTGSELLSGSVNTTVAVRVRALRTSHQSQYEQIIALVQAAASSRSPLVRMADRYSVPFTIISFTIAGVAWAVSRDPVHALEVLVVATPCPLLIATPVAIVSGMSRAAKNGIIMKGGVALERLARIKTIAFDKTGTLTRGTPQIDRLQPASGITPDDLLATAASAETASNHILAAIIVQAARQHGLDLTHVTDVHEEPGRGLWARHGHRSILIGRRDFLAAEGVSIPTDHDPAGTATHVARDERYLGLITFADQLRPEAKSTLHAIRRLDIRHILMLTGDHLSVAQSIARQLGIADVKADCLPADKVAALQSLPPSDHPVAMVGDGVNDAPTLAASDVGIALGAKGSTAASQSADVVIMLDDLSRVPAAITIARRSVGIALQSILVGIGLSIILMLIAATGAIKPVYGALLQEVVDIIVILNALRARTAGRQSSHPPQTVP